MKKILPFIFLLGISLNAQHTISGTFSPAKDYSWLIAYQLKSGTQVYAVDTAIKNGEFSLEFPEKLLPGTYRLVYAVPQEEFYFDVIYNGQENIKLTFITDKGVEFTTSQENILFSTYFNDIQKEEHHIINYYATNSTDVKAYQKILKKYQSVQESYEKSTKNFVANEFVKANKPYIPSKYESLQDYVKNRKASYFDHLNLSNSTLQASGFLTDKLTNYVFTALPLEQLEKADIEIAMQSNIDTVFEKLTVTSDAYTFHILHHLWAQISGSDFNDTADYIYNTYLKKSPAAVSNSDIINKLETYNRLRIGTKAPELSWKNGDHLEKLSTLNGAENYVLVFWSSTCGHCLKELPELHKELKKNTSIKVIAIGLEDDITSWEIESKKLDNFTHAIALGKWESEYAKLYDIHATPTYYILDADKRIIAKPESDKDVVEFLKK